MCSGKLMLAFGEDNIIWGTDSVWYGPNRPVVDAFRAFQIPERMREEFGYPELTPTVKEKILGLNACRLYGIDAGVARGRRGARRPRMDQRGAARSSSAPASRSHLTARATS